MLTEQIIQSLRAVREQKPLKFVNITNFVVMNNTANALLAIGASPIMAHSQQELQREMMSFSGALVINQHRHARQCLDAKNVFLLWSKRTRTTRLWFFDPVGCGASTLRTCRDFS
ncbi:hydroxyethylthiazole kinase [Vibrio lentus]|nr:hydroxyethylthiazole kinase [Vibrio lentus]